MLKRIRVQLTPTGRGSRVWDADTNEEVSNLRAIRISSAADEVTIVTLELAHVEVTGTVDTEDGVEGDDPTERSTLMDDSGVAPADTSDVPEASERRYWPISPVWRGQGGGIPHVPAVATVEAGRITNLTPSQPSSDERQRASVQAARDHLARILGPRFYEFENIVEYSRTSMSRPLADLIAPFGQGTVRRHLITMLGRERALSVITLAHQTRQAAAQQRVGLPATGETGQVALDNTGRAHVWVQDRWEICHPQGRSYEATVAVLPSNHDEWSGRRVRLSGNNSVYQSNGSLWELVVPGPRNESTP